MTRPARIPSDINRPDKILGPFTARQVAILATTAGALYLTWTLLHTVIVLPVFLIAATPFAALGFLLAVGQRDGLSLDRLLLAAIRHRLTHRPSGRRAHSAADHQLSGPAWLTAHADLDARSSAPGRDRAPRRPAGFPARAVTTAGDVDSAGAGTGGVGVVDLGSDGLVVIAAVTTVNLTLRTPTEQDGLVDAFARYLHTLTAPVQILVRAVPLDLTRQLHHLHAQARQLPHPALVAAADAHREHLAQLASRRDEHELLTRQVLLVLREPALRATGARGGGAEHRLLRRLGDAATLLAALDVTVTPLPAAQTTDLLTGITNPDHPANDHSRRNSHRPQRRRHTAPTPDRVDDDAPRAAAVADPADVDWGLDDWDFDDETGDDETGDGRTGEATGSSGNGANDGSEHPRDDSWPDTEDRRNAGPQDNAYDHHPNDTDDPTRDDDLDDAAIEGDNDAWGPDPWDDLPGDHGPVGRWAR